MNEFIFFSHIFLLVLFVYFAKKQGLGAMIALAVLQVVLANLFVTKQITLFALTVTPTDAYILGSLLTANLIQEYYGKEEAAKLIKLNFLASIFLGLMALIQITYLPAPEDMMHPHFYQILQVSPRILAASIASFFLTQKLDLELFSFLRKRFSLTVAMMSCLAITQAFDTILFSLLALWGVISPLLDIMILSYLIKMTSLAFMTPLTKMLFKRNPHAV